MKRPSFQFYPGDWLSSRNVAMMRPEYEGGYIRLLCYMWGDDDCSLPDDDNELASLSRLNEGWFNGGSTSIRKCFEPHPEKSGFLTNSRLLEERKKQDVWRKKSQEGGKKSGETRAKNKSKGGSTVVEPKGNTSSSSSKYIKPPKPPENGVGFDASKSTSEIRLNGFDRFWSVYPKKVAKPEAMKAWKALRPDDGLVDVMLQSVERSRHSVGWLKDGGSYVPNPSTWIRQRRWEDETSDCPKQPDGGMWL